MGRRAPFIQERPRRPRCTVFQEDSPESCSHTRPPPRLNIPSSLVPHLMLFVCLRDVCGVNESVSLVPSVAMRQLVGGRSASKKPPAPSVAPRRAKKGHSRCERARKRTHQERRERARMSVLLYTHPFLFLRLASSSLLVWVKPRLSRVDSGTHRLRLSTGRPADRGEARASAAVRSTTTGQSRDCGMDSHPHSQYSARVGRACPLRHE